MCLRVCNLRQLPGVITIDTTVDTTVDTTIDTIIEGCAGSFKTRHVKLRLISEFMHLENLLALSIRKFCTYFSAHVFLHMRTQCMRRPHFKSKTKTAAETTSAHVSRSEPAATGVACCSSVAVEIASSALPEAIHVSSTLSRINCFRVNGSHSQSQLLPVSALKAVYPS